MKPQNNLLSMPAHAQFRRAGIKLATACLLFMLHAASDSLQAATIVHNNDTIDPLNAGAGWTGGIVPGSVDTAAWTGASAGGTFLLGGNLTWHGIQLTSPSGPVTINPDGNTLTLGTGGIDMSAATQNLTIGSNLTIRPGNQVWNVANGQTLTLASSGTFTQSVGAILTVNSTGVVQTNMTGFNTTTNGILGAWVAVSSPGVAANDTAAGFNFATLSSSNTIIPYTTGTSETTAASAWGGIPSGNSSTVNYDINVGGTPGATGLQRIVNTIRYTGTGANQTGNNTGSPLLVPNGIMNAGSGPFVIAGTAEPFATQIGSSGTLVLAAETAPLTFDGPIVDPAAGTGGNVTITGTSLTTFTVNSTYTGATTVSGGNFGLAAVIGSGGGTAFTNRGTTVETSAGAISGTSTVTQGSGITQLNGVNTYTGATAITGGTLELLGDGSINSTTSILINGPDAVFQQNSSAAVAVPVTLTTGTLTGVGTIGSVTVTSGSGGVVSNGNGNSQSLTIGTLTFNGAASLNLNFPVGSPALVVTGALTTTGSNGKVVISGSGAFANGLNNLISFGSFSGSISDFTAGTISGLNGRQILGSLQLNGSNIAISVVGDTPVFTGSNGGVWITGITNVVGPTPSWALKSNGTPTDFWPGDTVEFNDSVNLNGTFITPLTTTATLTGNVIPSLVTFNNNKLTFTITSSNGSGIGGSAAITMNGTNSVILSTSNTYTGATNVNAGTLDLANGGVINGSSIVVGTGGALIEDGTSSIVGASTLSNNGVSTLSGSNSYAGATAVNSGSLRITGSGSLTNTAISVGAAGNLQEDGTASIGGAASITSNGTVTLNGNNNYSGATTATTGTFTLNGNIGATAVTVGSGATFTVNQNGSIGAGSTLTSNGLANIFGSNGINGAINVQAGTLNLTGTLNSGNTGASGKITVGNTTGLNAVMNINGGLVNATNTGAPSIQAGSAANSNGVITLSSGVLNSTSELWLSSVPGAYGEFVMTGGTANIGAWLAVSRGGGNGLLQMSGGSLNVTGNNITVGSIAGGSNQLGVASFTGGTTAVTNGGIYVGELANGIVNISGSASVTTANTGIGVTISNNTAATGILNLNGGSLTTFVVQTGAGTSATLNFNGGTLVASTANTGFLTGLADTFVNSRGGTIDNGGNAITIGQSLLAPTGSGVSLSSSAGSTLSISGTGFVGAPVVTITGGGGSGATAVAHLSASGSLSLVITNPGIGYTSTPTFNYFGGGGTVVQSGAPALATNVSGGITFQGLGATTLTGNNTYTGPTVVNAGTLILTTPFTSSTAVTIAAGATLRNPGFLSTSGVLTSSGVLDMTDSVAENLTVGGISFNAATLDFDILNNSTDQITSSGAATISGNNVINLELPLGQTVSTGTYVLLTASSGLGSDFSLGALPTNIFNFSLANSTATQEILVISGNPVPAIAYWTGLASASGTNASNQWGFGVTNNLGQSNWSTTADGLTNPQQVPGSITSVIMTASNAVGVSGTLNTQLDSQYAIKSLTYNVPASTGINNVVIDTNGNLLITGTGGVTLAATSAATGEIIDSTGTGSILLAGSQIWANNNDTQALVIDETIAPSLSGITTFTLSGTGSGGFTLGGPINNGSTGVLALVLNQAGITQIDGANTYSGGTTFTSGTIQLGSLTALGSGPITFAAGSTADLQLNGLGGSGGSLQVGDLNTNAANPGNVIIESGATPGVVDTLAVSISGSDVFAGTLRDGSAGILALSTAGSGTLKLTGTNPYSGGTTILGNGIQINSTVNIGSVTLPNTITLQSGTLETLGASFDLGSNKNIVPGNAGTSGIQVDGGTLTISGSIYDSQDSGDLAKTGTGNLIVSGQDSHSGSWFVTAGNLYLTNTNNSFGGVILASAGTTINVASLSDYGVNSALGNRAADTAAGTDSVTQGVGIHIVGGTLQYTGSTAQETNRQIRIGIGTATIDASGSVPSATLAFTYSGINTNLFDTPGNRTLNLTGSNTGDNTFAIGLTDQGANPTSLEKSGPGTWELTGSNANTGATTITGGILRMGVNNTLGSGANIGSISPGAILDLNDTAQSVGLFSGTGTGHITNEGSSTAILTVTGAAPGTFTGSLVDNTGKVGLTVSAGGVLTLAGSNAYTGPTTVTSGTLIFASSQSSVAGVTVGNGGVGVRVTPTTSVPLLVSTGLTVGQTGTSSIVFDFGNLVQPTVSTLISTGTGTLAINGPTTIVLQNSGSLGNGTLTLIDYTGALAGSFSSLSLVTTGLPTSPRSSATLIDDTANTSIDVTLVNDNPVWTGTVVSGSGTRDWDIDTVGNNSQGTQNWQTLGSAVATTYRQLSSGTDAVLFNDLASSSATNVNIVTKVSPYSVTVSSNVNNYTFSGIGGISGATGLTKSGSSTLTIANNGANSYTGPTTINGGTLSVSVLGLGGANSDLGASSNAASNLLINNATLQYSGASVSTSRAITIGAGTAGTIAVSNPAADLTITGATAATSGTLVKSGPGTLTLTANNNHTGGTVVNSGTLTLATGGATGTILGPLTINQGAVVNLTAGDALGYTVGSQVTTISVNGGSIVDLTTGNEAFSTNFVLTGGTVASLGTTGANGGSFNFDSANGYGVTTDSSSVASVFSAGIVVRSGNLGFNVAAGSTPNGVDLVSSGVITGGGLLKTGNGTMQLTSSNTYTGATAVNAGRLVVSGSLSGTASVSVASGATLTDNGLINNSALVTSAGTVQGQGSIGPVSISSGGTLAPGKTGAITTAGALTANGNVSLADATSVFSIRLGVASPADNDLLTMSSGSLSLNGASLQLTLGPNYSLQALGFVYVIVNGGAGATGTGVNEFAQGTTITASNGASFNILYAENAAGNRAGSDIVLVETAVPEPGTWAMLLGGLGILAIWRKRNRAF
jgi:fibronectin-binding autotransporter adhesin